MTRPVPDLVFRFLEMVCSKTSTTSSCRLPFRACFVRLEVLADSFATSELTDIVSSFCLHDGLDTTLGPALVAILQDASLDSTCCLAILHSLPDIVDILKINKVCSTTC